MKEFGLWVQALSFQVSFRVWGFRVYRFVGFRSMKLASLTGQQCLNDELKRLQAGQPAATGVCKEGIQNQSIAESCRSVPSAVQNGLYRNCLTGNAAELYSKFEVREGRGGGGGGG